MHHMPGIHIVPEYVPQKKFNVFGIGMALGNMGRNA
jgi:hypothetical protein